MDFLQPLDLILLRRILDAGLGLYPLHQRLLDQPGELALVGRGGHFCPQIGLFGLQ